MGYREQHPDPVPGRPLGQYGKRREGQEPQRVLGMPLDWFGPVDREFFRALRHPVRAYRRWSWRRRHGPYVHGNDDPGRARR